MQMITVQDIGKYRLPSDCESTWNASVGRENHGTLALLLVSGLSSVGYSPSAPGTLTCFHPPPRGSPGS